MLGWPNKNFELSYCLLLIGISKIENNDKNEEWQEVIVNDEVDCVNYSVDENEN